MAARCARNGSRGLTRFAACSQLKTAIKQNLAGRHVSTWTGTCYDITGPHFVPPQPLGLSLWEVDMALAACPQSAEQVPRDAYDTSHFDNHLTCPEAPTCEIAKTNTLVVRRSAVHNRARSVCLTVQHPHALRAHAPMRCCT